MNVDWEYWAFTKQPLQIGKIPEFPRKEGLK